jgi:acyl transferase domain-containing protein
MNSTSVKPSTIIAASASQAANSTSTSAPSKKRIVVVCPGRGTYTAETLGYLKKYKETQKDFLSDLDDRRVQLNEPKVTELDGKDKFSPALHTRGEHASTLIYACSYCDFMNISRDKYEIVAVIGNSMGWYISLALSGALNWQGSFDVIQSMGSMMKETIVGGQIIYPIVDDDWNLNFDRRNILYETMNRANATDGSQVYISIWLGGYVVLGGNKNGLQYMLKNLPKSGDYPFQLLNHAAFHTPLMFDTSQAAFQKISADNFLKPHTPLIDGRGHIWQPYNSDLTALYNYTLGHQVYAPYDFTKSVTVALKEFMPDYLYLLGPGANLGGAIGQILVQNKWKGILNKADFKEMSKEVLITT